MTRALLAASLIAATLLGATACGSTSPETGAASYLFERTHDVRGANSDLGPTTLRASLPNHVTTVTVDTKDVSTTFSDTVVIGTVSKVERSEAVVYADGGTATDEPQPRLVDWNDPAADERSLLVTLTSVRTLGGVKTEPELTFRLGVLVDSDPDRFEKAAKGLGTIAVLLRVRPDGRHQGEWIPALGPAGIGVVGPDDSLEFPGMGDAAKTFQSGIDTVAELTTAASSTG